MERSGLHQIKAVKVKRRWNGAMPSRMGHRNQQENQTCGTHVCFQNPSRCEFASQSQLPRNQGTLKTDKIGGCEKEKERKLFLF
jgi:hypothetical protein